jgi:hypothetical protein
MVSIVYISIPSLCRMSTTTTLDCILTNKASSAIARTASRLGIGAGAPASHKFPWAAT